MTLQKYLDSKYTKEEQLALTNLDCSYRSLTSLEGIEKLIHLEDLDCSFNRLTSIAGIEKLGNLIYFYCNNNGLTSLRGIECLNKLSYIDCEGNELPYSSDDLDIIIKEIGLEIKKERRKKFIGKLLNTNQ